MLRFSTFLLIIVLLSIYPSTAFAAPDGFHDGSFNEDSQAEDEGEGDEEVREHKSHSFKGFGAYRTRFAALCKRLEKDRQNDWLARTAKVFAKSEKDCKPCRSLFVVINSACPVKNPPVKRGTKTPKPDVKEVGEKEHATEHEVATEEPKTKEGEAKATTGPTPSAEPTTSATALPADTRSTIAPEITVSPTPSPTAEPRPAQFLDPSLEVIDLVSDIFRRMAEDEKSSTDNLIAVNRLISEMLSPEGKTISEKHYYATIATYALAPFNSLGLTETKPAHAEGDEGHQEKHGEKSDIDALFEF